MYGEKLLYKPLYKTSLALVLVGGLNWLSIGLLNIDFVNALSTSIFKKNPEKFNKIIYIIVGICTLYLLIFHQRQMFLSFLEETVIPPSLINIQNNPYKSSQIVVDAPGGNKVMYWSAEPASEEHDNLDDWHEAYKWKNSGVVNVVDGKATLSFDKPVRYRVGMMHKLLDRHIHYRIIYSDGVVSKVYTHKLTN